MVIRRPNEDMDSLMRRFKQEVESSGILRELREREYYYPPSAIKHQKKVAWKRKMLVKKLIREGKMRDVKKMNFKHEDRTRT